MLSYAELGFRRLLAGALDACVECRACGSRASTGQHTDHKDHRRSHALAPCRKGHARGPSHPLTLALNTALAVLNVVHLAYVSHVFHHQHEASDEYQDTWRELLGNYAAANYFSHAFILFSFCVTKIFR